MKKFIAIAMASAMTVSALAGCASNGTAGNNRKYRNCTNYRGHSRYSVHVR